MKTVNKYFQQAQARKRAGFSLIELLIVISIIGMLSALLLPAIMGARRATIEADVKAEVSGLDAAVADFYKDYGHYPPSRITLCEAASDWDGEPRSKALVAELWPSFDFSLDRDLNQDSDETDKLNFNGANCLLLFLGGLLDRDSDGTIVARGFSKNPANPFEDLTAGTSRTPPYFQFDSNRIRQDSNDLFVYVDKYPGQNTPIWYLSSYDGKGYLTADLPSGMTKPYLKTESTTTGDVAWNPTTFQLISPGTDNAYGTGGKFISGSTGSLSQQDLDNQTNFTSGKLQ